MFFDDSQVLERTIAISGALISFAIFCATALHVYVTWLIARNVSRYSRQAEAVAASRTINANWQEFNRLVVVDPEFRKIQRALEGQDEDDQTTQLRYMIFMKLNVIHDAYHASKAVGGADHLDANVSELIPTMRNRKDLVLGILDGARGYDQEFVKTCKEILLAD